MVKVFKESHVKDVEKLATDRLCEVEKKAKDNTTTTATKGTPDKSTKTSNRNLVQGQQTDTVRTTTSYFYPVWNAFSQHTRANVVEGRQGSVKACVDEASTTVRVFHPFHK